MTTEASSATPTASLPAGGSAAGLSRPSLISLAIKEKAALYAAYMPFIRGGGLFVPTQRPAALGDSMYLILSLMDDPTKIALGGKVIWVTPANVPGKQQGLGIQFPEDTTGEQARNKIETLLGAGLKSSRPTHTV
jgi:type IV pilus assembly protein PilZ